MSKLKPLPLKTVQKILKHNGWQLVKQTGSHLKYKKEGRSDAVGFSKHRELKRSEISMIISQSGKPREEFTNA